MYADVKTSSPTGSKLSLPRLIAFAAAIAAVISFSSSAEAHERFEVDAALGYRWGGRSVVNQQDASGTTTSAGTLIFDPGISFSGIVGYRAQPNGFVYLSYSRQQTGVKFDVDGGSSASIGKMATEYYQFGGNLEITRGIFVPYIGASVGFARFISIGGGADRFFFATTLDGGIKFDLHRHVHLRLLGRLPITFANNELFCGENSSCLVIDKFAPFVQGEAQLGIGVSF